MCFRYIYIHTHTYIHTALCEGCVDISPLFSITIHYHVDWMRHYVSNILFMLHPALWMQNSRLTCIHQYSKFDPSALKSLIRGYIYPSAPYSHTFRTSCCHWALLDSSLFFFQMLATRLLLLPVQVPALWDSGRSTFIVYLHLKNHPLSSSVFKYNKCCLFFQTSD